MTLIIRAAASTLMLTFATATLAQSSAPTDVASSEAAVASSISVLQMGSDSLSIQQFAWRLEAVGLKAAESREIIESFATRLSGLRMLAAQGEKYGLASEPRIKERLAAARESILAEEEVSRLRSIAPVTTTTARAAYDNGPTNYDEMSLSQILIAVSARQTKPSSQKPLNDKQALTLANSILRRLKAGESFEALAKKYSGDSASAGEGGRLPVIFEKDLKAEFKTAMVNLKPDQVSAPVRAEDGYHLIRLEARVHPTFESIERLLTFYLREEWAKEQVKQLQQATPVRFDVDAWLAELNRTKQRADTTTSPQTAAR